MFCCYSFLFQSMASNTAIAYLIMLTLSPIPNVAIVSYINKKPLLTKVGKNNIDALTINYFPNKIWSKHIISLIQKFKNINFILQVVLDHHHKDMIFINWAMSTILICWMVFLNLPGTFEYSNEYLTLELN